MLALPKEVARPLFFYIKILLSLSRFEKTRLYKKDMFFFQCKFVLGNPDYLQGNCHKYWLNCSMTQLEHSLKAGYNCECNIFSQKYSITTSISLTRTRPCNYIGFIDYIHHPRKIFLTPVYQLCFSARRSPITPSNDNVLAMLMSDCQRGRRFLKTGSPS